MEHHRIGAQHLGSQFCHNLTINSDDTSLDKLICLTTTANTCIGKELVQTKRLVRINVDLLVLDTLLHAILSVRIVVSRMLARTFFIGITRLAIRFLITTLALLVSTALSLTGLIASLTLLVSTLTGLITAFLALARLIATLTLLVTTLSLTGTIVAATIVITGTVVLTL